MILGHWLWAVGVCASFLGWGGGLARSLGLPRDPGSAGCLGAAFAIGCGGVLDLSRMVGPAVATGFVLIGVLLAAVEYLPAVHLPRAPRLPPGATARLLLAAVVLLGAVAIVGHVYYPDFSRYDDYPAYLVFPEKMLATGSLGFEPFSERRLLTSLGGLYFLQTLVLAHADFFFVHVIDPAFGFGLILLLLAAAMRRASVPPMWHLGVLLFALLLAPTIVNLTAILLPVALMIFSYLVVASDPEVEPGPRSLGRVVALGLVAAALVAIKPAYLPWIGSFLALVYGRRIVLERFRWRAWREPLALAALTVIVLLPWMLANLRDAGTAMYPLLGSGFHASRYGTYPPVWNTLTPRVVLDIVAHESHVLAPQLVTCGLLLGLASFAAARSGGPRPGAPALFVLLSGLVLVMVIVVGTAAQDLLRYSYPGVAAALLVGSYRMAVAAGRSGASKRVMAAAVAACLVVVGGNAHGLVQYYGHAASNLALAVLGPDARPAMLAGVLARDGGAERQAVLRMQQALPAGTPFLERLDYPFLLDFRRNEVLVADWPGAAGLPPGMPVFQGPEKLAAYLQLVRIRYVAYAYASEAQFPAAERDQWQDKRWIQLEANLAYDFQGNLAALMQTRRLVFKDDARAVIDLAEPAGR